MTKLPSEQLRIIAARARDLRLSRKLTQEGLAKRSGVSLGTLKRFESTGKVSLESLLKLAFALDALNDFDHLFSPKASAQNQSLDELLKASKKRQRGVIT